MNTDTKQQRYADMMLIFTTPHDVEGAVLALHAGGFGAKVHPEIYVGDSDATRFVHVWQPTDFVGDYDSPGAEATLNAFANQVTGIAEAFGGGSCDPIQFSDDLSKLPQ